MANTGPASPPSLDAEVLAAVKKSADDTRRAYRMSPDSRVNLVLSAEDQMTEAFIACRGELDALNVDIEIVEPLEESDD